MMSTEIPHIFLMSEILRNTYPHPLVHNGCGSIEIIRVHD
jgi:hypothetical protein